MSARDEGLEACGVLLVLAEICQQKVNVCAAMKLVLLQVAQMKVRYLIDICKTFGITSFHMCFLSNSINEVSTWYEFGMN